MGRRTTVIGGATGGRIPITKRIRTRVLDLLSGTGRIHLKRLILTTMNMHTAKTNTVNTTVIGVAGTKMNGVVGRKISISTTLAHITDMIQGMT